MKRLPAAVLVALAGVGGCRGDRSAGEGKPVAGPASASAAASAAVSGASTSGLAAPGESLAAGAEAVGPSADADPTTLVVMHSWSGRTERLGRELGAMLGAKVIAYHDAPIEGAPARPPSLDQVLPRVSLAGVRTLFLGFPVWGEAPSPFVLRLISSLRFDGVRVVPFYSFIHELQPASLAALRSAIEARGGSVAPELRFLIPLSVAGPDLDARAQHTLLSRRDLWSQAPAEIVRASCEGRNAADGAALCQVPAGVAWLGDAGPDAPPGAPPPRRVRVPAFEIDRAEITVAQYAKCVAAGGCRAIDFSQSFCRDLLADSPDQGALPVPCATYPSAESYCRWAGMRLPREAEWVRAGRGEGAQSFPWGDVFAPAEAPLRGNFGEKRSTGFASYSTVPEDRPWAKDGFRGLAPGCSFPAGNSPFGLCDLSGNLAEWVSTEGAAGDVAKGGSWLDAEAGALHLGTSVALPSVFSRQIGIYLTGIRCARDRT
jgi:formylglycine-generating enzyme required for sulfatase activity